MKDNPMSKDQEKLDKAAAMVMRLKRQAERAAEDYCEAGDKDTAAKLWLIAARLTEAYSIGRTIETHDGITAAFGGDGK